MTLSTCIDRTESKKKTCILFFIILALSASLQLIRLSDIPRVFVDEAWDTALGLNLIEEGTLRHPFIEGFGGMNIRFVQNRIMLPILSSGIFRVAGYSVFTSRLGSALLGTAAVLILFLIACRWFGPWQAFFIGLFTALHPWWFNVSRRARPEIYYIFFAILLLWMLDGYFRKNSAWRAAVCGLIAGLAALTHPNGILISGSVGLAAVIWLRGKSSFLKLILFGILGFALTILPWLLFLYVSQDIPGVDLKLQYQMAELTKSNPFIREIIRWKNFLDNEYIWPIAPLMVLSWLAAWYRSTKYDKFFATLIVVFSVALFFVSVTHNSVYLTALVWVWASLIVRFVFRLCTKTKDEINNPNKTDGLSLKAASKPIAVILITLYLANCIFTLGMYFYNLKDADLDRVIDRAAQIIDDPDGLVLADPVFFYGKEQLNYGPYFISYRPITLQEYYSWAKEHDFKYMIRPSWYPEPPLNSKPISTEMPYWRDNYLPDHLCRITGKKIGKFKDPVYGPFEVYKLDFTKRPWF
jgi:4-amino-4-deoxy-L-arabinose transferase-like glycosyltransferase